MNATKKQLSIVVISLAIILISFCRGFSQIQENTDKTLSPYFFIKSDDPTVDQLPLRSTSTDVNIAGVIAAVKVKQVYKNQGTKPIEAIYVFPASTRAAINAMRMRIGERVIEAVIKEKSKAREEYETAKKQGKSASLLEEQRPNVFQMNVANIMPGDEILVELDYTELLIPENAVYEFVYPTVVGPRYSNQPPPLAMKEEKWVANPFTHQGEKPFYTFNISCNLEAGMPIADIRCVSHEANVNYENEGKARLTLKDQDAFQGNRDFIVQYKLSGNQIASGVMLYQGKDENFFLAMIQPPAKVKLSQIPPREYVFIVDVSGSMNGYPIEISKKLMKDLIGKLRTSDKFNVLLFAGSSQLWSETSLPATKENIDKAISFIDRQNGGGGTELLPALKKALSLGSSEGISRTFIIATDGYVTVEKEAFSLIRNNMGNANFFAFGIGTSVNRYLIEGIAHAGLGLPFIISKKEEAETTGAAFRDYVGNPVLTDIHLKYNGIQVYDVEPKSIPDVFSQRPIIIFGKWKGSPETGSVVLTGLSGEGKFQQRIMLAGTGNNNTTTALRYLWARERIRNLDDFGSEDNVGEVDGSSKEITRLGLQYNLLTRYTSFIAVDSEVRNKTGQTTTVQQPLPLPEGVGDLAVGGVVKAVSTGPMLKRECKQPAINSREYQTVDDSNVNNVQFEESESVDNPVHFTIVGEMPEYPGGSTAMQEFIAKNLNYPQAARNAGIQGVVYVSFMVYADGSIHNIKVLKGIGGGCDEETIRLIRSMPPFKPAKQAGKPVKSKFTLPVRFSLG
ncbi:MAG: TonB family protein [Bacteroidetes bacterium]|nr:TonB family protein [Bacteroidota bacterium]